MPGPVTFSGNLPSDFEATLRQTVYELQVSFIPNVEWTWRFSALAGGTSVGVALKIPPETTAQSDGWGKGKDFDTDIPADTKAARGKLSEWFKGIHAQFREYLKDHHDKPDHEGIYDLGG